MSPLKPLKIYHCTICYRLIGEMFWQTLLALFIIDWQSETSPPTHVCILNNIERDRWVLLALMRFQITFIVLLYYRQGRSGQWWRLDIKNDFKHPKYSYVNMCPIQGGQLNGRREIPPVLHKFEKNVHRIWCYMQPTHYKYSINYRTANATTFVILYLDWQIFRIFYTAHVRSPVTFSVYFRPHYTKW